jgi:hypothetical protein
MLQSLQEISCLSIAKSLVYNSLSLKQIPTKSLLNFKRLKALLECLLSTHKYFQATKVLFSKSIKILKKLTALQFKNQKHLLFHLSMI